MKNGSKLNMKCLLFLMISLVFLAACGVDSIPEEGLTNAVGQVVFNEGVAAVFLDTQPLVVEQVEIQCAGVIAAGEAAAHVTFRVTTEDETLGANGPLYGAGSIVLGESDMRFNEEKTFTCQGSGQLRAYQTNPEGDAALVDWLLEQNYASLTAQIDGVMTPLTDVNIVGWARAAGGGTAILTNNENITELTAFQCQGTMIPNSSQAAITFTAETAAGQKFGGGGILETGVQTVGSGSPDGFQCTLQDDGWVSTVLEPNSDNFNIGHAWGFLNLTIPTLQVRNSSGQQIMFETFMTLVVPGGVDFEIN